MVIKTPFENRSPTLPFLPVLRTDLSENFFPTDEPSKVIDSSSSNETEVACPSTEVIMMLGVTFTARS